MNSKYIMSKEKFIAKEQSRGTVDGKILRENCMGRGYFSQSNLVERQAKVIRYHLGIVEDEEPNQTSRVSDIDGGSCYNGIAEFLLKLGFIRKYTDESRRRFMGLSKVGSGKEF